MANVLYLGISGFPRGLATIQKQLLISKSIQESGGTVFILCRKAVYSKLIYDSLPRNKYDGIYFRYTSRPPFYIQNFIKRNISKQFNKLFEIKEIRRICKLVKIDSAIIKSNFSIFEALYYFLISRLFGFKVYLNIEEYHYKRINTYKIRLINNFLFDKFFIYLFDGFIPISDYIVEIIYKKKCKKPILKIPILVDLDKISKIDKPNTHYPYFLFCGAAGYSETIEFIVKAFDQLENPNIKLILVVNGDISDIDKIKTYIERSTLNDQIQLYSDLELEQLYSFYKGAAGLLIPLRNNIQDKARFPHKIGEYLASGRPIITSNVGEINKYFVDNVNAFISESNNIDSFVSKMKLVINFPEKADKVGQAGLFLVKKFFDYKIYGPLLNDFLESRQSSTY